MYLHFPRLLFLSVGLAVTTGALLYFVYRTKYDFDNLYLLVSLSTLCSFVLFLAIITFFNQKYATFHCNTASYSCVGYKGRYTSGLGAMNKDEIKANQWILTIIKDGSQERFVLDKDISTNNQVTKTMNLQFCKGILGTEILHIEQIQD